MDSQVIYAIWRERKRGFIEPVHLMIHCSMNRSSAYDAIRVAKYELEDKGIVSGNQRNAKLFFHFEPKEWENMVAELKKYPKFRAEIEKVEAQNGNNSTSEENSKGIEHLDTSRSD